jgi:hypothetical protein
MSDVAPMKAAKSVTSWPQEEENPSHGLDESFVNSADKIFDHGNHCHVLKARFPNRDG